MMYYYCTSQTFNIAMMMMILDHKTHHTNHKKKKYGKFEYILITKHTHTKYMYVTYHAVESQ